MSTDEGATRGVDERGTQAEERPRGPLTAAVVEQLAGLDGTPPDEHGRVYDELHGRLVAALAATSGEAPRDEPTPGQRTSGQPTPGRPGVPRPPGRGA